MIDYNVSDHWAAGEPTWVKSLASSLDRHHGVSTTLPLTVIIEEIGNWIKFASGPDAWMKRDNRRSLLLDLEDSVGALGNTVRTEIAVPLGFFKTAFTRLNGSAGPVLKQPPGKRTSSEWAQLATAAEELLMCLDSDTAVASSWNDLVATAQTRTLKDREYRPIAELLFEQLLRRGGLFRWLGRR